MSFEHSNAERVITRNGKQYVFKVCDICGSLSKSNAGFEISVNSGSDGLWGFIRRGYCNRCAALLDDKITEVYETLIHIDEELREKYKETREKRSKKHLAELFCMDENGAEPEIIYDPEKYDD